MDKIAAILGISALAFVSYRGAENPGLYSGWQIALLGAAWALVIARLLLAWRE